jgi:hypothetical protein
VGLGHLLLEVNPEDAFENQPVRGERGLVVSAARLDNRAALLEAFNVSASEAPQLTDGHLASLAFDRCGEELCAHPPGRLGAGCLGSSGTPSFVGQGRLWKGHPLLLHWLRSIRPWGQVILRAGAVCNYIQAQKNASCDSKQVDHGAVKIGSTPRIEPAQNLKHN